MDQHPIPQNVTGFQFKLIGSMTVKQFGYLAFGVILAVIIYYLPLKGAVALIIKGVLIPLLGSIGAILAFVPVDGRPIDVMTGNFFHALISPNQYIYHKNDKKFSFSDVAAPKPDPKLKNAHTSQFTPKQRAVNEKGLQLQKILIKTSESKVKNSLDAKEAAFLNSFSIPTASPTPTQVQSPAPIAAPITIPKPAPAAPITPPVTTQPVQPQQPIPQASSPQPAISEEKEKVLTQQLEAVKKDEVSPHTPEELAIIHQKALDLEKQVQAAHTEKQQLEAEIIKLKSQLIAQKTTSPSIPQQVAPAPNLSAPPTPSNAHSLPVAKPTIPVQSTPPPHVRSLSKDTNQHTGILVSDTPNVITGIVKDARGNVLPNILVEIKDKAGNPVRAFKTNALGNFASATPLSAGQYKITLEDLKKEHTFDEISITANDQIMLPIEIVSYDKRELLRKELFS